MMYFFIYFVSINVWFKQIFYYFFLCCLFSSDLASEFEAVCQERDMLNRQIKEDAVTVKTKLNQIHKTRKFILESDIR